MLPAPLTPPLEESAEALESYHGLPLEIDPVFDVEHQQIPISTPMSNTTMGMDSSDERLEAGERLDIFDDEDMSDGGAVLSSSPPYMGSVHVESELLDSDSDVFQSTSVEHMASDVPFALPSIESASDDIMEDAYDELEAEITETPNTLAAMEEQFQYVQDVTHMVEFQLGPDEQHTAFINNSITPSSFHHVDFQSEDSFFSVPEVQSPVVGTATTISTSVAVVSQNAAHLLGPGWAPSAAMYTGPSNQGHHNGPSNILQANFIVEDGEDADNGEVEDQFNLSLGDFLHNWGVSMARDPDTKKRLKGPSLTELYKQRVLDTVKPIKRSQLHGELCDVQRINWKDLGVSRSEARRMRRRTYKNYMNLRFVPQWHPSQSGAQLHDDENFFRFRRMDFDHDVHLSHFQLRNLMACATRDHVFYAGRSKVYQWNPTSGTQGPKKVIMDLTDPTVQPIHALPGGIQISTLTAKHNILVAGGFSGEYAMVNLKGHKDTKHTEGLVTDHQNSITNHVQVQLSRTSLSPQVVFASNDNGVRILDVGSNKFIADHSYNHAINCTAISPDQRLRVLVGDTCLVMICDAETGEVLQSLEGHQDYGFACDWADDGWTVATGNQDMHVKIWDARKWTTSSGAACPVATITAEMAGVRNLKFSPLGSGKRVLAAAEPADIVSIIDAETFSSKQTLSFFGEIGGMDFTNGGRDLLVANCDMMRGGLMEYERCDFASASLYGFDTDEERSGSGYRQKGRMGYDWLPTDEEVTDHPKSYGTLESRKGNAAMLASSMGHF